MQNSRIRYVKPYKHRISFDTSPVVLRKLPVEPDLPKFDYIPVVASLGVSIMVFLGFAIINGSYQIYFLIVPVTMLIYQVVTHWRSNVRTKEKHQRAINHYDKYLDQTHALLVTRNHLVGEYYTQNYLPPKTLFEQIFSETKKHSSSGIRNADNGSIIWNTIPENKEFLTMRIGTYKRPSPIHVQVPDEWDNVPESLTKKISHICEINREIPNSPFVVDFNTNHHIAIRKNQKMTYWENTILFSMMCSHAYDDLKLVVIKNSNKINQTSDILRHLPHTWNLINNLRFHSTQQSDLIYSHLLQVIIQRHAQAETNRQPAYIIVTERVEDFFNHPISQYFESTLAPHDFHIVFVLEPNDQVPSICSMVIDLNTNFVHDNRTSDLFHVTFDHSFDASLINRYARTLSRFELVGNEKLSVMPDIVTFFDLLDEANGSAINTYINNNWKKQHAVEGLVATVGMKSNNALVSIDLRDGKDGPHAIIAGMTGSGKSELLQTIILSLCVNYSPEEVAFAFIDFKEGGMALQFKDMPHESGILSNNSDNVMYFANRAITMLKQEKKRRGSLLQNYGLDINRYHDARSNNKSLEALPHLFVIIDESAEVVDQFNEFMSEMVSLSRVGRSMGVHLILSTQNPSRTVDKQIFDNSNLKICLSVLSEDESKAILKTSDAARITNRGQAYLLTGNGLRYELFQSAYTGAAPTSNLQNLGSTSHWFSPEGIIENELLKQSRPSHNDTQLRSILASLKTLPSVHDNQTRRVFSEPLPDSLYLYDISNQTKLDVSKLAFATVVGKIDDLNKQSHPDAIIDFDECKNLIVYGSSGSGKTTLLETLIYDMLNRYGGTGIQVVVVANGISALTRLSKTDFIVDVLTDFDDEKLYRLPKQLRIEAQARQQKLISANCGLTQYNEKQNDPDNKLPRIVIVFDGFQFYQYAHEFNDFISFSAAVGIHIIATNDQLLPRNLRSYFGTQILLQIHDDLAYSFDSSYKHTIERYPGRGIYKNNTHDNAYEIQIFQPSLDSKPDTSNQRINCMNSKYTWHRSFEIQTVQTKIVEPNKAYFRIKDGKPNYGAQEFPIGIMYEDLTPFNITKANKGYLCSLVGDKQQRDKFRASISAGCIGIGEVLHYNNNQPTMPIPNNEANIISAIDAKIISNDHHLFVIYEIEKELTLTDKDNEKLLLDLLETKYTNRWTLIVISAAALILRSYNSPLIQYCMDMQIIAIGGKHDSHVRFVDVSRRIININNDEAYVTTSSTTFEQVKLFDIFTKTP